MGQDGLHWGWAVHEGLPPAGLLQPCPPQDCPRFLGLAAWSSLQARPVGATIMGYPWGSLRGSACLRTMSPLVGGDNHLDCAAPPMLDRWL